MAKEKHSLRVRVTDQHGRPMPGQEMSVGTGGWWGSVTGRVPTDHKGEAIIDYEGNATEIYRNGERERKLQNFKPDDFVDRPYTIVVKK